jgi:hypothetical protein
VPGGGCDRGGQDQRAEVSLPGNPSLSLPMGLEPSGTPFGMMNAGPAARDLFTPRAALGIAQAVAHDPEMRRPVPDIARLKRAPKTTNAYKVSTPPLDSKPWAGIPKSGRILLLLKKKNRFLPYLPICGMVNSAPARMLAGQRWVTAL